LSKEKKALLTFEGSEVSVFSWLGFLFRLKTKYSTIIIPQIKEEYHQILIIFV